MWSKVKKMNKRTRTSRKAMERARRNEKERKAKEEMETQARENATCVKKLDTGQANAARRQHISEKRQT